MIRIVAIAFVGLGLLAMSGGDQDAHSHRDAGERFFSPTHTHTNAQDHAHPTGPSQGLDSALDAEHAHALLQPAHDPQASCECESARRLNRWCRRCNVGYVAAIQIESAALFSTLDPHGHELDFGSIECRQCRDAMGVDGFCDSCGMGFVRGMTYFSRLTYGLSLGRVVEPTTLGCAACRANATKLGWCDRCMRGMVGATAIFNRETFDRTAQEYRILIAAVEKTSDCELCARAMVVHRTCPSCLISYGPDRPGQLEKDSESRAPLGRPSS